MKTRKSGRFWSLILFVVLFPLLTIGAVTRDIRFTHLTNNEGLPGNSIYTICQDYKGFVWIGTKSGLCKYDGRTISVYDQETVDGKRVVNGQIRQVFEDKQHRLWVVTQKGINLYDREKDLFRLVETDLSFTFRKAICQNEQGSLFLAGSGVQVYNEEKKVFETLYSSKKECFSGNITSLTADSEGRLWIGKKINGLICVDPLNGDQLTHYMHDKKDNYSLISNQIINLYTDKKGSVWIGTESKGVCYFDRETQTFCRIEGFPDICVRSFMEDSNGNIWIGTEDGLYIYSPETGYLAHYRQNYNDRYSLNDNAIYTIFRDREDNMLVGTYFGGINIFSCFYRQFFHYDYGYSEKLLSGKAVRQIIGDKKGNLWISTEDGGLNYYDQSKEEFVHYKPEQGKNSLSYHNVHALLLDSYNNLWIGTFLGGLNKYNLTDKTFTHYSQKEYPDLIVDNIFSLLEDRDKKIWIGTTNGLSIYDPLTNRFKQFGIESIGHRSIDYIYEDTKGDIWVTTRNKGVFCYDKSKEKFRNYSSMPDGKGLPDNYVNYVYEDRNRNIWIGTHEGGLCKYNQQAGLFTVFTEKDGLPSNTIFGIIESDDGNLWISTSNGLSCLDINDCIFTNYSVGEGLPDKQFNYNSVYKAPDGLLYFGTINGMIAFYPEELQSIQNVAQVALSSLKIFGKTIKPSDKKSPLDKNIEEVDLIRLSSRQANYFTLNFVVPTLAHPNSTFFAIKINNEKDWRFLGLQNQVTYSKLPPGEYLLQIKAAFNNRWTGSEPIKSLKIIVDPPFWKSAKVGFIYFGIFLFIVSLIFLFRTRKQEEKQAIQTESLKKEKIEEVVEIDISEKDKALIKTVEEVIINHLDDSAFTLNDLLKEVGIGRTQLHVKLKNIVQLSTTEFITKIRLNESLKLLAKGKTISEVAYATGFSSPSYYSRCFKKIYGISPNEYLKKGRGRSQP